MGKEKINKFEFVFGKDQTLIKRLNKKKVTGELL